MSPRTMALLLLMIGGTMLSGCDRGGLAIFPPQEPDPSRLSFDGLSLTDPGVGPLADHSVDCWDTAANLGTLGLAWASANVHYFEHYGKPGSYTQTVGVSAGTFDEARWTKPSSFEDQAPNGCRFKAAFQAWQANGLTDLTKPSTVCNYASTQTNLPIPGGGCYPQQLLLNYTVDVSYQPVTVQVSGPTQISSPGSYSWTADIQGGSGGTFSWDGLLCDDQLCLSIEQACHTLTCTLDLQPGHQSFTIGVDVTDGETSDSDERSVIVNMASTLEVGIDGPSMVNQGETCSWFASVTGGTPPYSYSWSGIGWGSDSWVTAQVSSPGTLYLTVTDSDQTSRSTFLQIAIDQYGSQFPCFV